MAHLLRFIITATAVTVARFLHLFKFGLVVYGTSNVPRIGGSRETPAYFFFVFHKLLEYLLIKKTLYNFVVLRVTLNKHIY